MRTVLISAVVVCSSVLLAGNIGAQTVTVDAAPGHMVNSFSPMRALGGAIDRLRGGPTKEDNEKHTERLLTNPVLKEMLGAGWQPVTYRQNTELMIEAWHWNSRGTWSNTAKQEGYFTGSPDPTDERILHSWAYPLPHRGATLGDGNGWSRLTDGNLQSYWKSNPYLTQPYTGEDDSLHPQWVMIDLGAKINVNAIKIDWANPYAKRYIVQFWTGELEPFYEGIKICADWGSLYWEPAFVNHLIQAWKDNGLPPNVPFYMTEGNDLEDGGPETVKRGLWLADYVGSMLTAGASGTYYFHYIATDHGGDGFLPIDKNNRVLSYSPQYLA